MLGVPSKILESCVTDSIVDHVFTCNQLVTENQWAYRKGHSTNLLLAHLTETWRHALDSNLVVGVLFIDFQTRTAKRQIRFGLAKQQLCTSITLF